MKENALLLLLIIWFSGGHLLAQETEIRYLSGTGKDHMVEWDFFCSEGMNSGKWTKIGVPSCWELQGFGAYNYGQDQPREERADEYGLYKHSFKVPVEWKNKEVKIVFEAVMTDCEVKINGQLAGALHQGAFYEFNYSISNLLNYGKENLLEVKVNKVSSNESINHAERRADFWIFGGIYRPVYLKVLPKNHIDRVAVNAMANGEIEVDLFLNSRKADKVKARLLDIEGKLVQELADIKIEKKEDRWTINTKASDVKTWNPEHPNLYQLELSLEDQEGNTLHQINQRIGFRTVELLEGDGIYVNGQRIKFKGVNRHSFYPESGRTTSKELSIEHVKMMKDMNMNAVRMAHYPPDVHFLDVCDSLGLFVIDEICTWQSPSLDTDVGRKIVKETVVRDVNHPSILLWANGNEGGWNTELDDDYGLWDIQNREVIHPWGVFRKTNTLHYINYKELANDGPAKDHVFFPTEFLHGLYDGGHGAGLEDYWKQMWNMPTSAGGFLWVFADEAVVRTDKNNILDTDFNHAPDGIVGPYGEKEGSYFTIKEVWSPIFIENRFIREDFNGLFRVENRYHFTNLKECTMKAKWIQFDGPNGGTQGKVFSENDVVLPALSSGEKGTFTVALPQKWQSADALHLTAFDMHGMEVFAWAYPVKLPNKLNKDIITCFDENEILERETEDEIVISVNKMTYAFSKETGLLDKVMKNNVLVPLSNGPVILGNMVKIDTVQVFKSNNKVDILVVFGSKNNRRGLRSDSIKWTVHANGMLNLKAELMNHNIVSEYFGITFSFPESEVKGMKWLGDGPYRVWRNRMKGTKFQIWENDYNNTVTGESGYAYPEFKGFFSSLYWAKIKGKNNNGFTIYCHSPHTFLRMLTPQHPSPGKNGDPQGRLSPKFPEGDISFVKNIPAIGTKFQDAATMGPHGNPQNVFGKNDDAWVIELTFEF